MVFPCTTTGSSITASNLSPGRAVALDTEDCKRTEIGVPAGTLKAVALSALPKGSEELPSPVLAGVLLQLTANRTANKTGRAFAALDGPALLAHFLGADVPAEVREHYKAEE